MNQEPRSIYPPTPAIILAVGDFANKVIDQVRTIYLRSDQRRSNVSLFYSIELNEAGILGLITHGINNLPEGNIESEPFQSSVVSQPRLFERRNCFRQAVKSTDHLINELWRILHEIRNHPGLIDAGWMEEHDVPINIFLVLDVKEPYAAGIAIPIIALLNEVVSNTSLCQAHVLINSAVFPQQVVKDSEKTWLQQDLDMFTFLQELNTFLHIDSEVSKRLYKTMRIQPVDYLGLPIYLFDLRKEGVAVVSDQNEMIVMVGNALLALLQDDLARFLLSRVNEMEAQDTQSFYHGIGTTAIIYDPLSLQEAIASQVVFEFLERIILSEAGNFQLIQEALDQFKKEIADLRNCLERLVFQISPTISHVVIDPKTLEFDLLLRNLNLQDLDYEYVHTTPWVEKITNFDVYFESELFPLVCEKFDENSQDLKTQTFNLLDNWINELPFTSQLYPGGLDTFRRILEEFEDTLIDRQQKLKTLDDDIPFKQQVVSVELSTKLEDIQTLLRKAPKLTRLIRILPRFLRYWLAPLYYFRRYGPQIVLLKNLKDECVDLLQRKLALLIQTEALDRLNELLTGYMEVIQNAQNDTASLLAKMQVVQNHFSANFGEFPLGKESNGWANIFRVPAVDTNLAEWAYKKWYPEFNPWITEMYVDSGLFDDWKNVKANDIADWLKKRAAKAYKPLWDLTLEDIFGLWAEPGDKFKSDSPLIQSTIITSINASRPLLRPDFDAVGGPGISLVSRHALICHPEWRFSQIPETFPERERWRLVYTGDPYVALFTQVRPTISLEVLIEMLQSGKRQQAGLNNNELKRYEILSALAPDPPVSEILNPDDLDVINKRYRWKFQPRGSGTESQQEIRLYISKSRYEYYRHQPRFIGQWNLYAESEMPEVRMLATEFQKLHSENNWSTYNLAFNVLKFVQTCIPYSFDKDTTGHTDWPRYPIETLMEQTGDCEDVAILCAAIIARLGYQVVLLVYPKHIAFGVAGAEKLKGEYVHDPKSDRRYFFGEATADGLHLGQIPKTYRDLEPEQILPVNILIEEE
jgi:hypothetical protein